MGDATIRTGLTSRGFCALSPYNGDANLYAVSAINLGNNFISKLEIVSALNSFNISTHLYHYNNRNCTKNYNPKVYLSAIQSVSMYWFYDEDSNRTNLPTLPLSDPEKSGSWINSLQVNK